MVISTLSTNLIVYISVITSVLQSMGSAPWDFFSSTFFAIFERSRSKDRYFFPEFQTASVVNIYVMGILRSEKVVIQSESSITGIFLPQNNGYFFKSSRHFITEKIRKKVQNNGQLPRSNKKCPLFGVLTV